MKKRSGFVSNSSSSSFIVIGNEKLKIPEHSYNVLRVPQDFGGEYEFGWGPKDVRDFGSRLNFAYLQTQYGKSVSEPLYDKAMEAVEGHSNTWLHMLEEVLKDGLGVEEFEWNIVDSFDEPGKVWGYIDHQSAAGEGENTEMFNSYENLKLWLFAPDSYIHLDNDNY